MHAWTTNTIPSGGSRGQTEIWRLTPESDAALNNLACSVVKLTLALLSSTERPRTLYTTYRQVCSTHIEAGRGRTFDQGSQSYMSGGAMTEPYICTNFYAIPFREIVARTHQ